MMSLLTSNHCEMKVCQCLMFYFEVWYQSAQEVTVSLMSPKLIAAAKDSWACFLPYINPTKQANDEQKY